jgi:DeoR/GlpR family transcriptional regulator of sugar metabolism
MNTSRVQRILKLLTALHSGGALSVDDLSREMDVTRRTIFRDLSILEKAGVPFQYNTPL